MRIGWLCPFIDDPMLCVGAVVEVSLNDYTDDEYVPVILPETRLEEAMRRGPIWVLSMMAYELLVFGSRGEAEGFLFETFQAHLWDLLTPAYVEFLLDKFNGYPRRASDYGLIIPVGPQEPS